MSLTFRLARVAFITVAIISASLNLRAENATAVKDVLKLKDAGIGDETIIAFIQGKDLNYDLSADSIVSLRDKGLSSGVINAMLVSGKGTADAPSMTPPATTNAPIPATPPAASPAPPAPPGAGQPAVAMSPQVPPRSAGPDVAFFYSELSPYGRWILAEDSLWYWQPTVAVNVPDWRPYWTKGRWVWTDQGWYWLSDYSWGWAPFHYGRWQRHAHYGWLWAPDRLWGPAWVVWRSGGEYCGWAPLPPGAVFDVKVNGFMFRGQHVAANFDFGLGWNHFSFCFVRELGETPRQRFHHETELRAVFSQTSVNFGYSVHRPAGDSRVEPRIVNHGIPPAQVRAMNGRRFEPMQVQEQAAPGPGRSRERLDTRGKRVEVYRPPFEGRH